MPNSFRMGGCSSVFQLGEAQALLRQPTEVRLAVLLVDLRRVLVAVDDDNALVEGERRRPNEVRPSHFFILRQVGTCQAI